MVLNYSLGAEGCVFASCLAGGLERRRAKGPVFYSFIGLANIPHLYSRSEEDSRSQGKKAKLSQTPSHHQIVTSISVGHTALPLAAREPGELGKTD